MHPNINLVKLLQSLAISLCIVIKRGEHGVFHFFSMMSNPNTCWSAKSPNEGEDLLFSASVIFWMIFCICLAFSSWENNASDAAMRSALMCLEVLLQVLAFVHFPHQRRQHCGIQCIASALALSANKATRQILPQCRFLWHEVAQKKNRTGCCIDAPKQSAPNEETPRNGSAGQKPNEKKKSSVNVTQHMQDFEAQADGSAYCVTEQRENHAGACSVDPTHTIKALIGSPRSVTFVFNDGMLEGRDGRSEVAQKSIAENYFLFHEDSALACAIEPLTNTHNHEEVEFFLPKLYAWCRCQSCQTYLKVQEGMHSNGLVLSGILRPWQADFLSALLIITIDDLVQAEKQNAKRLRNALLKWRKINHMKRFGGNSCSVAIHIWARAANVIARSRVLQP
jgi:hypothetical protein